MYHKQTGADSTDLSFLYSQCLVARNPRILTDSPYCGRQVSRLIDQARPASLPGLPVVLRRALSNHGDEIVRDLHPLPFSPDRLSCGRTCPTPSALFKARSKARRASRCAFENPPGGLLILSSYHNPCDQTMCETGGRHPAGITSPTKTRSSHTSH